MLKHTVIVILINAFSIYASADSKSSAYSEPTPYRRAFFGELHVHTSFSLDAYIFGTRITPDEAYKFGKGEIITLDGISIKRAWPLDFMAVTDHAENLGTVHNIDNKESKFAKSEIGKKIARDGAKSFLEIQKNRKTYDPEALASSWNLTIQAANRHNDPGKFTTFIGYEWTATESNRELNQIHRNVIFKGNTAPIPFSSHESSKPEDLWSYLEINRTTGIEALAIPHNPNLSYGSMYNWYTSDGKPIDKEYALRRSFNEPLSEIYQSKGQSETHPILSPNDEYANFEVYDRLPGDTTSGDRAQSGNYIRDAYGRGLAIADRTGVNPYRFGVVAGSDFHNALSTSDENAYVGGLGGIDPTTGSIKDSRSAETLELFRELAAKNPAGQIAHTDQYILTSNGSGGLAGVWAEENTRDSIYAALRRQETFATSGTRIRVRFFGGWQYQNGIFEHQNWLKTAYEQGSPMGGNLPTKPPNTDRPKFLVWAIKDPNSANLDRIQIIKVWLQDGSYKEKIFDAALAGKRGLAPTPSTTSSSGSTIVADNGKSELKAIWQDPEFSKEIPAVYYIRVLEVPTPRWTTILSTKTGEQLPPPYAIQERAWSSPIWYIPERSPNRSHRLND